MDNIKNIKDLTNFSGNSYDVVNSASKLVGAIKDGATAINKIGNSNFNTKEMLNYDNYKGLKSLITVGSSVSHSKSESKSHNESVEKGSLKSGNNISITSKDESISISGNDVEAKNNLSLNAEKDITIKASKEKNSS